MSNEIRELERNKAVALRFKKFQGTPQMPQVEKEVLAPGYDRVRGGNFHLANNARGQGWPEPGLYLRTAFPDRVDVIERVIAEGDRVGLLFRLTATHQGNLFGIPPTGRKVDVYEIALLRIVEGQMVEGWFMMDEAELLRQLGVRLPQRGDRTLVAPPLPSAGETPESLLAKLALEDQSSPLMQNKMAAVRAMLSTRSATESVAPARKGFQHLHDRGRERGHPEQSLLAAFPDRRNTIDLAIAEGDQVWTRFYVHGTHTDRCTVWRRAASASACRKSRLPVTSTGASARAGISATSWDWRCSWEHRSCCCNPLRLLPATGIQKRTAPARAQPKRARASRRARRASR